MSGARDDQPARRGAVRPPPSTVPDDAPETIDVPRMEPPPASLEAMMHTRRRTPPSARPESPWLVWVVLVAVVLVAAAIAAYVTR